MATYKSKSKNFETYHRVVGNKLTIINFRSDQKGKAYVDTSVNIIGIDPDTFDINNFGQNFENVSIAEFEEKLEKVRNLLTHLFGADEVNCPPHEREYGFHDPEF